jgi:hypothetical protein
MTNAIGWPGYEPVDPALAVALQDVKAIDLTC